MLKIFRRFFGFFSKTTSYSAREDASHWCAIATGAVRIQGARGSYIAANNSELVTVRAFYMAKYPVTNAEFARFIAAGGYNQRAFWTREGWENRRREAWIEPKYWDDPQFNLAEQPVVGITWYEAYAYCRWLDSSTEARGIIPPDLRITLPTEAQWQRAAQGDTNRQYPWGDDFEVHFANTKESEFDCTTPVSYYPNIASPFGVLDMAGNVLEWTMTDWNTGSNDPEQANANRVLRGGSFANSHRIASVQTRSYSNAYFRRNNFGFRVCAVPIKAET